MNYITLNGKRSLLIKGLLISELPPITKPMVRTRIEEIDGRDGDVVTKLGYAAYDKKMTIGLFGDFNIDDIIQYFDSEGTVVFSNEPDKLYRYKILNQIDFDRLCRFRTATVVFHVQPFKVSAVNNVLSFNLGAGDRSINITNNGNVISRPSITVYFATSSETISLSIHGYTFYLQADGTHLTLDGEAWNAYKDGVLANDRVNGRLNQVWLPIGQSQIIWPEGKLSKIVIENSSRWI